MSPVLTPEQAEEYDRLTAQGYGQQHSLEAAKRKFPDPPKRGPGRPRKVTTKESVK